MALTKVTYSMIEGAQVNVLDFGADPTGVADSTAAIQAAFDAVTTPAAVYIPSGTYKLTSQIAYINKTISIIGDGIGATTLLWDSAATSVGIKATISDVNLRFEVRHLTFLTQQAAVGTALEIDMSGQLVPPPVGAFLGTIPNRAAPRGYISDLEIRGQTSAATNGFDCGVYLKDVMKGYVSNVHVRGKYGATQSDFESQYGIRLSSQGKATEVVIDTCWIFHTNYGVHSREFEGVMVTNCNMIGVYIGVDSETTDLLPQFDISNTHINAHRHCINFLRMRDCTITNNLLYHRSETATNGTAMQLNACANIVVANNNIRKSANAFQMNGIVVQGNTNHSQFFGNTFINLDQSAHLFQNTATNNRIGNSVYNNTATRVTGNSLPNLRVDDNLTCYLSADQAIADNTPTVLAWDQNFTGFAFWHSETVNNSRITIPTGVVAVEFTCNVEWEANATGTRTIQLLRDGDINYVGLPKVRSSATSAGTVAQNFSTGVLPVTAGEYYEVRVTHTGGAPLNVLGNEQTWFSVKFIR